MTTDFRALCVELTDCLEKADWPHRYKVVFQQWMDIAYAALAEADGPAVPEGREPASVAGEPSDEELRDIWETGHLPSSEELANDDGEQDLHFLFTSAYYRWLEENPDAMEEHKNKCIRAVFNAGRRWGHQPTPPAEGEQRHPEPVPMAERLPGPTDEELNRLWFETDGRAVLGAKEYARAVLARWGHEPAPLPEGEQRHPEPVPVSERLPGPEDCDAEWRCWWFLPAQQLEILRQSDAWSFRKHTPRKDDYCRWTHWLPAHALPLPAGEVEP